MSRLARVAALLLIILHVCGLALASPFPEEGAELFVIAGRSRLLSSSGVLRVAVADPEIADVAVVSPREVLVNGKEPGETSLHLWHAKGRNSYRIVVYRDQGRLEEEIVRSIGLEGVEVRIVNRTAILEGRALSSEARERAGAIARAFVDEVVNLLEVGPGGGEPGQSLDELIAGLIDLPTVEVQLVGDAVFLEGTVPDEAAYERAEALARAFSRPVVNLLQLGEGDPPLQQVIAAAIGDPAIHITRHGETVFLEGVVPTELEKERAERIAEAFSPRVVSLLQVYSLAMDAREELLWELKKNLSPGVGAGFYGETLFLEGAVGSEKDKERCESIAEALWPDVRSLIQVLPDGAPEGGLASTIARLIDREEIGVMEVEGTIFLEGKASSDHEHRRAVELARAFGLPVVDLLEPQASSRGEAASSVARAIGQTEVQVNMYGETLFLEGTVREEKDKERAEAVASALWSPVVNLIQVRESAPSARGEIAAELAGFIARESVSVREVAGTIFLEGEVPSELEHKRAVELARAFGLPVVDLLAVSSLPTEEEDVLWSIKEAIGAKEVQVRLIGKTIFLEGLVEDVKTKERARAVAEALWPEVRDFIEVWEPAGADPNGAAIAREVGQVIDRPEIEVREVRGTLFLEGTVPDEAERRRAVELARAFGLPVIDLLALSVREESFDQSLADALLQGTIERAIDQAGIKVEAFNGTVVLTGEALQEADIKRAEYIAKAFAGQVVNLIDLAAPGLQEEASLPVEPLTRELEEVIGDRDVSVRVLQGKVILEGTVDKAFRKERAERLASIYYPQVVSLIVVEEPARPDMADKVQRAINLPGVKASFTGNGILLEGTVRDQRELSRAVQIAEGYSGQVVNLLEVEKPWQVLLQVQVVEVDRSAADKLNIQWGSLLGGVFMPNWLRVEEETVGGPWARLNRLAAELEALAEEGSATILASPSLLTMSGEEATFLVGGEIPVVVPRGDETGIEWKTYGVHLRMTPIVEAEGEEVTVIVRPEVSTLDWNNGIRINNVILPALGTRRVETRVRVGTGATLVIGGLLQSEEAESIAKVPLLGDLPVLGALFRSKKFQRMETELLFFITPWTFLGQAQVDALSVFPQGGGELLD